MVPKHYYYLYALKINTFIPKSIIIIGTYTLMVFNIDKRIKDTGHTNIKVLYYMK